MFSKVFVTSLVTRFILCTDSPGTDLHISGLFVVETFTMLISQKQTLVSSDTSCAVGKWRDFFVRSHSVSAFFFFFLSPATLSLQTLTEVPNQQTSSFDAAQAVKTSLWWMISFGHPCLQVQLLQNLHSKLCRYTSRRTSHAHTLLSPAFQCAQCD